MTTLSPRFNSIYGAIFRGFIYQVFFVVAIISVSFFSKSFSLLLAGLVGLIFLTDLIFLIYISRNLSTVKFNRAFNHIYLAIYLVEIALVTILITFAWFNFGRPIDYPILAFFTPIILLMADWFLLGSVTSDLSNQHRFLSSIFYDIYTIMIVVYSISLAGVTLSALSIYWFDQGLGILNGFIAIYFLLKRIKIVYNSIKLDAVAFLNNVLSKTFSEVPVIIKTEFFSAIRVLNFFAVDAKTYVSPVVDEKEKDVLMEYLTSRAIELVPNIVLIRFDMVYLEEGEINIAVAISDGKISGFEKADIVRVYKVRIHDLEIVSQEDVEISGVSDELDLVKIVKRLVDNGVNSIIVSDIREMSKNAFDGWFIDVVKAKSDDVEKEIKDYLKTIRR